MSDTKTTTPFLSNRTYDALKWIAQIFLPALGAAYFGLSEIWGLPYGTEVVGSITVLDLFLGTLLGISTSSYKNSDARFDGALKIHDTDEKTVMQLDVSKNPEVLERKKEVLFEVKHTADELAP